LISFIFPDAVFFTRWRIFTGKGALPSLPTGRVFDIKIVSGFVSGQEVHGRVLLATCDYPDQVSAAGISAFGFNNFHIISVGSMTKARHASLGF